MNIPPAMGSMQESNAVASATGEAASTNPAAGGGRRADEAVRTRRSEERAKQAEAVDKKPAGRQPGEPPPPEEIDVRTAGLDCGYFEGIWRAIPDFTTLKPVRARVVRKIGVDQVSHRKNWYGLYFTGYIKVPASGTYTFSVTSDDGSRLAINDAVVINNDGRHPESTRSGSIRLDAGLHLFALSYIQTSEHAVLSASYEGPGIERQPIPLDVLFCEGKYLQEIKGSAGLPGEGPDEEIALTNSEGKVVLREPDGPKGLRRGLECAYYPGTWSMLPDFRQLSPAKTGTIPVPGLFMADQSRFYALRMFGYVEVPRDGIYTFYTISDDGSKLFIGGKLVVDNDGLHPTEESCGQIGLKAGRHSLAVTFFQGSGMANLSVLYDGPEIEKRVISSSAFYYLPKKAPPKPAAGAPAAATTNTPAAAAKAQETNAPANRIAPATNAATGAAATSGDAVDSSAPLSIYTGVCAVTDVGAAADMTSEPYVPGRRGHLARNVVMDTGFERAYLYDTTNILHDIGTLGGEWCHAAAVNSHGEVVGVSADSGGRQKPFLYFGGEISGLAVLAGGEGAALDINDPGLAVGWSVDADGRPRAVLWDFNGGVLDLNTMAPEGSGWILEEARAISDNGRVSGVGAFNGVRRTFTMTIGGQ